MKATYVKYGKDVEVVYTWACQRWVAKYKSAFFFKACMKHQLFVKRLILSVLQQVYLVLTPNLMSMNFFACATLDAHVSTCKPLLFSCSMSLVVAGTDTSSILAMHKPLNCRWVRCCRDSHALGVQGSGTCTPNWEGRGIATLSRGPLALYLPERYGQTAPMKWIKAKTVY